MPNNSCRSLHGNHFAAYVNTDVALHLPPWLLLEKPDNLEGSAYLPIKRHTLRKYEVYYHIFSEFTGYCADRGLNPCYVDLTAGPGYSSVEGLRYAKASPILAIETIPRFAFLILIEKDRERCSALRYRTRGERRCYVIRDDSNRRVKGPRALWGYVPTELCANDQCRCLVCIDPEGSGDISWRTVKAVAERPDCDIIGLLPAPEFKRAWGRHRGIYVPGVHSHMPPGKWKDPDKHYVESIENLGHNVRVLRRIEMTRGVEYQILFATKEPQLLEKVENRAARWRK